MRIPNGPLELFISIIYTSYLSMSNVKMSVTIMLPGGTMMAPQECGENPKNYDRNVITLSVKHFDKKTKKSFFRNEPLEFKTRKCNPVPQVINMSEEAYEYMTSAMCPEWFIPMGGISKWKKLSANERLDFHLERTCQAMGGISFDYVVFED